MSITLAADLQSKRCLQENLGTIQPFLSMAILVENYFLHFRLL